MFCFFLEHYDCFKAISRKRNPVDIKIWSIFFIDSRNILAKKKPLDLLKESLVEFFEELQMKFLMKCAVELLTKLSVVFRKEIQVELLRGFTVKILQEFPSWINFWWSSFRNFWQNSLEMLKIIICGTVSEITGKAPAERSRQNS